METVKAHRRGVIVLGFLAIALMITSIGYGYYQQAQARSEFLQQQKIQEQVQVRHAMELSAGSLHPILSITVRYPNGSLEARYVDKNDLMVNNFISVLECFFGFLASAAVTDINNGAQNICVGAQYDGTYPVGATIQTGTGTTAAARTDYKLQTPYQSAVAIGTIIYDSGTGNLTMAASFTAATGYTMSESGLIYTVSNVNILYLHDVFTGIVVSAGSTVAVQYSLELLTVGFTNNVGNIFDCYFAYTAAGGSLTASPTDAAGVSHTVNCVVTSGLSTYNWSALQGTGVDAWFEVGTGTTAVGRSSYYLATAACGGSTTGQTGNTGSITASIYSTTQIKVSHPVTCTSATTVTEAGEFQLWHDTGANNYLFMVWRQTFAGVSVGANQAVTPAATITVN